MARSSRDDVENIAQGNAPAKSGGRVGFVGGVLVLFMLFGLVNLGSFWFGPMFSQSGVIGQVLFNPGRVSVDSSIRSEMWPSFRSEAKSYVSKNLMFTNLVLKKYLSVRERLRNAGPFGDYIMVRVLRFIGFFSYFFAGLIIVALSIVEGFKRNKEKRLNFEQFSSTTYHFVLNTGVFWISGLFTFYLFVPNKIYIPTLINVNIPSIFYSPSIWAILVTAGMSYTAFIVTSNLSTKV